MQYSPVVMCEGGRRNCNIIVFSTMHFGMVPRRTYEKSLEILEVMLNS